MTVEMFLTSIMQSTMKGLRQRPYLIMRSAELDEASSASRETINYCVENGLVIKTPLGSRAYEFEITEKGVKMLGSFRQD